jgi:hypothetical protein
MIKQTKWGHKNLKFDPQSTVKQNREVLEAVKERKSAIQTELATLLDSEQALNDGLLTQENELRAALDKDETWDGLGELLELLEMLEKKNNDTHQKQVVMAGLIKSLVFQ